ncbi:MAG: NADH-quinone oxidoreductase subunit L, partial [Muribaculaceae bacterium]|nr:NADH-quinone oxidoreductase subunit L [Muribaculaceae bacterium]
AAYNRFYFDELYLFITHKIIFNCVSRPIAWFDRHIIDGTMDMFARVAHKSSWAIRGLQSGNVQMYVLSYLIGALLLGVITFVCML